MATIGIQLNFENQTEEAFNFYKSIFGGEFDGDGIMRMGDVPTVEGYPPTPEDEKNLVAHVALELMGGIRLMGSDVPPSLGQEVVMGNNVYITLMPDTRAEADRLFKALSEGGKVDMPMQEMFWGDYYGSLTDKFGVCWMINTSAKE